MKKLLTIQSQGEHYTADVLLDDFPINPAHKNSVFFVGDFSVDWDGSPRWREDPSGQPDTTLHLNGKPINSWKVPGIVVPPEVIKSVPGIVLGSKAEVSYKGKTEPAVVFDVGPHSKLGEGTPYLAQKLGINPHHSMGGEDAQIVTYRFWPGVPAQLNGVTYRLQKY